MDRLRCIRTTADLAELAESIFAENSGVFCGLGG
jgi:hypothetical protein